MKSIIRWILFIPTILIVNLLVKTIAGFIGFELFPKFLRLFDDYFVDPQFNSKLRYSWLILVCVFSREYLISLLSIFCGMMVLNKNKKLAFYTGLLICLLSYLSEFLVEPLKLENLGFFRTLIEISSVLAGFLGFVFGVFKILKDFNDDLDINSQDQKIKYYKS